jgi:hypothetical protein
MKNTIPQDKTQIIIQSQPILYGQQNTAVNP